jgi:F0F1-type ATP synthase assembly protein I
MAILTAIGAVGGWFLDGWLETDPVFVLLLGGLGFVGGLYAVWRAFSAATSLDEDASSEDSEQTPRNDPGP